MTVATMPEPILSADLITEWRDDLPVDFLINCLPEQGHWTMEEYDFFADKINEGPRLEFSRGEIVRKEKAGYPLDDLIDCLPVQGKWTMEDYDFFASRTVDGPLLEFSRGRVVTKAMPLPIHTMIVAYLRWELEAFVRLHHMGVVYNEGAEFRFRNLLSRLPDVVYMSNKSFSKRTTKAFTVIDLAMEVLSPSRRREDLIEKRRDYQQAGVLEYWLVDPKLEEITVLKLVGGKYAVHGLFCHGEKATSALLKGFEVDVTKVFSGGKVE